MKYKQVAIGLDHALSFWQHFEDEERVFLYNPIIKELIIGARRLRAFGEEENYSGYPYLFSSKTFFPAVRASKWQDFGNETIAFANYLVQKNGEQIVYYAESLPKFCNTRIESPLQNLQTPSQNIDTSSRKIESFAHSYTISSNDYEEWKELFAHVYLEILKRNVNKVVISREVGIRCETTVKIESVLISLMDKNPTSFIFAYHKNGKTFLGATPEILVEKKNDLITSYALAGTIFRDDCNDEEQKLKLLNDGKNLYEHKVVIDSIINVMKDYSHEVILDETKILTLKNLHHLQTRITCKDDASLSKWVSRLHPTPALGGNPVNQALAIIAKYERHDRGLYAAPFGLIRESGDGIFVAGIRSALIQEKEISAYTGCGIVEKSSFEDEYQETNNKLKTILESL